MGISQFPGDDPAAAEEITGKSTVNPRGFAAENGLTGEAPANPAAATRNPA